MRPPTLLIHPGGLGSPADPCPQAPSGVAGSGSRVWCSEGSRTAQRCVRAQQHRCSLRPAMLLAETCAPASPCLQRLLWDPYSTVAFPLTSAQLQRVVRLLVSSSRDWAFGCVFPSPSPGTSPLFRQEVAFLSSMPQAAHVAAP